MPQQDHDPLDPSGLARLRRLGGNAFVSEMIGLFLDFVSRKLDEALAGRETGNLLEIEKAVHAIKSSAHNVGAIRLVELSTQIEQHAREGQSASAIELLPELENETGLVLARLREIREAG